MNSFELNKILGAILGTCLAVLAINIASGALFSPKPPAKPGYEIAVQEEAEKPGAGAAAEKHEPIETLLASANVEKGKATAKQCQACHTLEKSGPNRIGPNLYGVVGRKRASEAGFNYSSAMKGKGGEWTFDELNRFLTSPKGYIPGTAMTFAGLPRDSQRADVIDYLHTLSDNPMPLPKAADNAPAKGDQGAAPPQAGAAPAAGNPGEPPPPGAGTNAAKPQPGNSGSQDASGSKGQQPVPKPQ